jgi:TolB protein
MMKKIFALAIVVTAITCGRGLYARIQTPQITTGTSSGVIGVKIAVPEFQPLGADAKTIQLTNVFNKVLWDDLDYSGVVTLVSRSFYPLGKFSNPGDIKPDDWTTPAVDAQFVAFGSTRVGEGRITVDARLWDLKRPDNREALGRRYGSSDTEEGTRLIAHQFADAIVELIGGGIRGIALTKLAYISDRTGAKELYIMDYDGNDSHALTAEKSIVLTPSWSPDGEKIAFTSFKLNEANIEILSRVDRKPYAFVRQGGTTTTPVWSPDGGKIAYATSRDGSDTEIYVADWNGRNAKRLTVSKGVDISPFWNPRTGREIAFVSDRSGTAQIYIMDAEGTNVRRIIMDGGTAVNPAWSPDGQRIAFAWQKSRTSYFDIYVHDLATGRNTQLTQSAGDNERPTWSPDGRHLAFESTRNGTSQIYSMLADGTKVRQLTQSGKNQGPAWSGYLGQ